MVRRKSTGTKTPKLPADIRRQAVQKELGKRIVAWRLDKHLSQEAFADICGIHRSHMGQVERGETNVTLGTLVTITVWLEQSLSQLFDGIE